MILKKYKLQIDKELENYLSKQNLEGFEKLTKKYILNAGKRLRPTLSILSYFACGGQDERNILMPALAVELFHNYTLILDDVMDEDEFRRNNPTVYKELIDYYKKKFPEKETKKSVFINNNSRFSASIAILLGNMTNVFARKAIHNSSFSDEIKLKSLKLFDDMEKMICKGQINDLYYENKSSNEEAYLDMIEKKTGILFSVPMKIGALLAGADEHTQHEFFEIGKNIAIAFQIKDDLKDIQEGKGHELGSDIKNKKQTLLMIKLLEKVDSNILAGKDVKSIIKLMYETKSVEHCEKLASFYYKKSINLLSKLNLVLEYKMIIKESFDLMIK